MLPKSYGVTWPNQPDGRELATRPLIAESCRLSLVCQHCHMPSPRGSEFRSVKPAESPRLRHFARCLYPPFSLPPIDANERRLTPMAVPAHHARQSRTMTANPFSVVE